MMRHICAFFAAAVLAGSASAQMILDNPPPHVPETDPVSLPRLVSLENQTNAWNNKVSTNETSAMDFRGATMQIASGVSTNSPWRVSQFNTHKTTIADHIWAAHTNGSRPFVKVVTPTITNSGNLVINPAGGVHMGRPLPTGGPRNNTNTFVSAKMVVDVTAPVEWEGAGGGGITNLGGLWMYGSSPIKFGGVSRTNWPSAGGSGVPTNDLAYLEWKSIVVTNISGAGIKAALALANAGDEIYLPAGVYNCSNVTITIPTSNLTIRGAGWGAHLNAIGGQTGAVINLGTFANTTLKDFKISGLKTGTGAFDLIYGNQVNNDNITMEHLWLTGSRQYAIASMSASQIDWHIRNCRMENSDERAIYANGTVNIEQCFFLGNDVGIYADSNASEMRGCYVSGGSGWTLTGSWNIIADNYFTGTTGDGLGVGYYSAICGNTFNDCVAAIALGADKITVSGNTVYRSANGQADIALSGDYNTVVGNVCISATGYSEQGILVNSGSDNNTVVGNTTLGHDTAGIQNAGAGTLLSDNNTAGEATPYKLAGDTVPRMGQRVQWFHFGGPVTQNVYNVQAFGFTPSAKKYYRIVGRSFSSTVTVDIVSLATNTLALVTNGTFILPVTGMSSTTWTAQTNAANRWSGYKLRQRGAGCTNFAASVQYFGE